MPSRSGVRRSFSSLFDIGLGMSACRRRTAFPSLALFLLMAAFMVTKTGRDALYFQRDGFFELPKAYLGIAILAGPAAAFTLSVMRFAGPRRSRVFTTLVAAAVQAAFYWVAEPGGGLRMTLVWLAIPLQYGVLLSQAWLLAADLLEAAPRPALPELYSVLGASSMFGGLTGAAAARSLGSLVEAEALFLAGSALLAVAAVVMSLAQATCRAAGMSEDPSGAPAPPGGRPPGLREMAQVLRQRYPMLLAMVGVVGAVVGVLIEFQFYWSVSDPAATPRDNVQLFANFYLWLNGAALLVQLLGMPPLQRRVGVRGSLLVLPVALCGGAALMAVSASTLARAGLRIAESGLKSSIHRSNWEQAYLPLERRARAMSKLLVDGVAARVGEGIAAIMLLVWLRGTGGDISRQDTVWIAYALLVCSAVWLALIVRMGPSLASLSPGEFRAEIMVPDG